MRLSKNVCARCPSNISGCTSASRHGRRAKPDSMIDDVSIVPLRAADVPLLAALARDIWRAHYPGIISVAQIEYMLAERYDEAVIRAELEAENVWWDVLKRDGRMAAYV